MSVGGSLITQAKARESEIRAVVTRCGCGNPAAHAGAVCPMPRAVDDLGRVAYYHRNPLRQFIWNVGQHFKHA